MDVGPCEEGSFILLYGEGNHRASTPHPHHSGDRFSGIPVALLRKEAAYNAVGVAAYELHDYVDWDPWFRGALVQVWGDPWFRGAGSRSINTPLDRMASLDQRGELPPFPPLPPPPRR